MVLCFIFILRTGKAYSIKFVYTVYTEFLKIVSKF